MEHLCNTNIVGRCTSKNKPYKKSVCRQPTTPLTRKLSLALASFKNRSAGYRHATTPIARISTLSLVFHTLSRIYGARAGRRREL